MQTGSNGGAVGGASRGIVQRFLDAVEWLGNKLPDPVLLFVFALLITWVLSAWFSTMAFVELDPRTNEAIVVKNQLTGTSLVTFMTGMVKAFTSFAPLGVVLVALLGVGVAEHSGFINAVLKTLLSITPKIILTPMLIFVANVSHTASDAGYVLVIPLAGVIYYAAGRHPLLGIVAAFAGVSGGFSANPVISTLDPMLAGLTQTAAQIVDPSRTINPICNYYFTASSTVLIMLLGWVITDFIIEPRLASVPIDGDPDKMPKMEEVGAAERRGMIAGVISIVIGLAIVVLCVMPIDSPLRGAEGRIFDAKPPSPLINSIVPLIFFLFLLPGTVHGYVSGKFKNHRDVIAGMSKAMGSMGYYLVMAFAAANFIEAFNNSNLGALLAIKGAGWLKSINASGPVTIVGIILLTGMVNLVIGSASAKWTLLAPIFVPMLMQLGLAPELTQVAYRVGDSTTNIITPLMPYFPLVVVYAQRYVKNTGIGTLVSLMLPYSIIFTIAWTLYLLMFWTLGLPIGPDSPYTYEPPVVAGN